MGQVPEITTIIFDIGNVLVDFRWKDYLKECGYSDDVIRRISKVTVLNDRWRLWDRGDIEEIDMIRLACEEEPEVEEEITRFFNELTKLIKEFDYSTPMVKHLSQSGYQVYLLSNYPKHFYELSKECFQFLPYVDGGIISYEINKMKPEPDIYQALINKYQINPMKAVFLEDLEANLNAAKAFGIHTIQVKDYDQMLLDLEMLGVKIPYGH